MSMVASTATRKQHARRVRLKSPLHASTMFSAARIGPLHPRGSHIDEGKFLTEQISQAMGFLKSDRRIGISTR